MRTLLLFAALFFCLSCGHKAESKGPAKHYHLTGRVVSVNAKDRSASIDAAAIPDYMEAMTMEYPIADRDDFQKLKPGEQIEGTLDVYASGDYSLTKIKEQAVVPPNPKP